MRLFPALWVFLAVILLLWLSGFMGDHVARSLLPSLFYVRNLVGSGHETAHLWSLSLEEQFYLLWPLLFISLPGADRKRFWLGVGLLVIVTAWRLYAAHFRLASSGVLYERTDFRLDTPLYGCLLALAIRIWPGFGSRFARQAWSDHTFGVTLLALLVWIGLQLNRFVPRGLDSTVIGLLGSLLVLSQLGEAGVSGRWLSFLPLVLLGRISYGVYLWQQLFLGKLRDPFAQLRLFPIGLLLTLLVAAASYRWLEKPLLRLKDRRFQRQNAAR